LIARQEGSYPLNLFVFILPPGGIERGFFAQVREQEVQRRSSVINRIAESDRQVGKWTGHELGEASRIGHHLVET
jgi:hypothetical protein